MGSDNQPRIIVVGGATGTGKSELALDLADHYASTGKHPHIINADALQLYRGMDIGTAKLPVSLRRGYTHYMLDVLDVTEQASVAAYQRHTRELIDLLLQDDQAVIILVGGTGLYINAVVREMEFPGTDTAVRQYFTDQLTAHGPEYLHRLLAQCDPAAAATIIPENTRRVIRALEVGELTGKPFATVSPHALPIHYPYIGVVLSMPRAERAERLEQRAANMWANGLLDETRVLVKNGLVAGTTAGSAIGYSQALEVLTGSITAAEGVAQTALATTRFAKRQDTWFKKMKLVAAVRAGGSALASSLEFLSLRNAVGGSETSPGASSYSEDNADEGAV